MNKRLEDFKLYIKDKNVTVLGIGISNLPLIRFLVKLNAKVVAADKRSEADLGEIVRELDELGVTLKCGENYLADLEGDIIFKTPGMRFDIPELEAARKNASIVTSEMEVFFELCPGKIFAVTGSDGKTTTTTLIYNMLTAEGYKCRLGGNIGKPLLAETESMSQDEIAVLELSSFQLHTLKKSPNRAVVTNMSPNHLDWHKDYEEYKDAKKNICRYQTENDILVVNKTNAESLECASETKAAVRTFGYDKDCDVYCENGVIYAFGQEIMKKSDIKIPGEHNVQNYMTAIAAVGDMVKKETIVKVAREFGGVPHRIELVRIKDGVKYYNSSIDSSPNRTINTLRVFDKVILIAGGKDKGISYDALGESLAKKTKAIYLVGKTAPLIKASLENYSASHGGEGGDIPIKICQSYEEAVRESALRAKNGDVVLMSNASTSFDMFRNFEERGNLFKKLVNEL